MSIRGFIETKEGVVKVIQGLALKAYANCLCLCCPHYQNSARLIYSSHKQQHHQLSTAVFLPRSWRFWCAQARPRALREDIQSVGLIVVLPY
jgi:hypothetical protein